MNADVPELVLDHKTCVQICTRWLWNKCGVVLPEFVTYEAEIADVLGFKRNDSYMIEVKVSRADFLRDKKKFFRAVEEQGVGSYRYYACPRRLIGALDAPDGWGLIYIWPDGHARQMIAPDRKERNLRAVYKGFHAEIVKPQPREAIS